MGGGCQGSRLKYRYCIVGQFVSGHLLLVLTGYTEACCVNDGPSSFADLFRTYRLKQAWGPI